jgi:DNA polymerase III subunit gamma/tau
MGRFVEHEGDVAVFALPNEIHRKKCEPLRPEVEAMLAAHFGRPVPVRLVVDTGQVANGADPRGEPSPFSDDAVDPDELVDAPAVGSHDSLERVTRAFPGAEFVDEP